ncbi:MAG: nucleotidyltransferase [Verrucomicrobiota bacterium]|nr:nucleotidyltransferase [Verrucomicrobiota bacterium]
MPDTFESLLVKLSRAGVDYLVGGGVAVCLNGFVRTTQDLDLLVEASPANLQRLLHSLTGFGQGFARELSPDDFPMEEGAVRVIEDFTVDLFTVMRSRTFGSFAAGARRLEIDGVIVRYLAPEALIELKSPSAREKDQLDVAALREIIAGAAQPGPADLVELTPPAAPTQDEPS